MATTQNASAEEDFFDVIFGNKPAEVTPVPSPAVPAPAEAVTPKTTADILLGNTPTVDPLAAIYGPADTIIPGVELTPDPAAPATPPVEPAAPAKATPAPATPAAPGAPVTEPPAELDEEAYTRQILTNQVHKLVKKGTFADIDDLDSLEFDEDSFDELMDLQIQNKMGLAWEQIKGTHEVVNGILSIIENGGNPDSIIDLFKEQQTLRQIDTATPEGKLEMIGKFYKDIVGLTPAQVQSRLKKIDTAGDDEIQSEFEIAESKYSQHFQKEQVRIQAEEKARLEAQETARRTRITTTAEALKAQGGHSATHRKLLENMYQPRWKTAEGEELSELDYQLQLLRNDPVKSIELARFVLDRDAYRKSITQAEVNQVVDQTYGKLKFTPKKPVSSAPPSPQPRSTAPSLKELYSV